MKISIIGAGIMGENLLTGLLDAGHSPEDIVVTDRRPARQVELSEKYGVSCVSNADAAKAQTIFVVVKPQDLGPVFADISESLTEDALVVSLCAGVPTEKIDAALPGDTPVVRVMPNTPARVGEGMAAISGGAHATNEHLATVTRLMGAVGKVVTVPEQYQDAVTAISGSGPAYLFFVVEGMIDAAVTLGLPRDVATELVTQTMFGSAKLLRESNEHPTVLRENVTSPGGTTAAALRELESHKVRAAFMSAMEAARDRSRELAKFSQ